MWMLRANISGLASRHYSGKGTGQGLFMKASEAEMGYFSSVLVDYDDSVKRSWRAGARARNKRLFILSMILCCLHPSKMRPRDIEWFVSINSCMSMAAGCKMLAHFTRGTTFHHKSCRRSFPANPTPHCLSCDGSLHM
jgi:hypothetical protein